ncbi:MAG: alginate lyase family protein [Gammaproteobacteria bacterium]|nr:alginate lyase family protein [Gammaproteobacteria bacterium]
MQTPSWYFQRLKSMSPAEILWRIQGKCLDWVDAFQIPRGSFPSLEQAISKADRTNWQPPFRVSDLKVGEWTRDEACRDEQNWCASLISQADKITKHKLSYFHLRDHDHGHPIQWNKDHGSDIDAPIGLAQKIDYRDFNEAGDCKLVWEPNRHQHLVVLARAYRASGNEKYAWEIKKQLESWLDQCPYGYGMNWRSPMELSIRLINWVWVIDLTLESGIFSGTFRDQLLHSIYLHLREITMKYSRGSSANNHLIGEAGGVFIATSYFPQLTNATKWQSESFEILCREIELQTFMDGSNKELALEYQFFVIQFFLLCGLVGKWCGKEFPPQYWRNVERQLLFIGRLQEGGGNPVFYGDADDGYVLNLGDSHIDPKPLLGAGALLFNNGQYKAWAPDYSQSLRWLFGAVGREQFDSIAPSKEGNHLLSHAFQDSGFYLLQSGHPNEDDRISVLFDCGQLGFGTIAAHGHADALSFTLKAFGEDLIIDPGTYDYFTYPEWRQYFRSTLAHNTLEVDGQDQSVMLGLFLWGKRAAARCLDWQPSDNGGMVKGEHNGYGRLEDPVLHRRTLQLDGNKRILDITDEVVAKEQHTIRLAFHFAPTCTLEQLDETGFRVTGQNGCAILRLEKNLSAEIFYGNLQPPLGWASNGYHRKQPCPALVVRADICGETTISCSISFT